MAERLRFERELGDLGLYEYDQTQPLKKREVVVGERITLSISGDPRFPGAKIVRWKIPGRVVKSYQEDANSALKSDLAEQDLKKNSLVFYWVDGGDDRVVKAIIKANQSASETEVDVCSFNVRGPKVNYFKYITSKPMIIDTGTKSNPKKRISFGNKAKPGVAWDWEVTMPANGFLKDLQTVKMGRKKVQTLKRGSKKTRTLVTMRPGAYQADQLDLGIGEDVCKEKAPEPKYSIRSKAKAGEKIPGNGFDTPSDELMKLDVRYSVDESFTYYVLFKPDKPDAIWVPVARAQWHWKAVAVNNGSVDKPKWVLKDKPKPGGGVTEEKYASTAEFPFYNSNTCENRHCEVKADGSIDCGG